MNVNSVERVLAEYEHIRERGDDVELEAVRAAIFIEDVLQVDLSDSEIDAATLGNSATLRALLARKRELG